MNNKGFAITGILYTVMLVFLAFTMMILFDLQNKKTILDELKLDTVYAVDSENNLEGLSERLEILELENKQFKTKLETLETINSNKSVHYTGTMKENLNISSSKDQLLSFSGTGNKETYQQNTDGTITILKDGYYMINLGIHGWVESKGVGYFKIIGAEKQALLTLENPADTASQLSNTITLIEYISKNTKIQIYGFIVNAVGGVYGSSATGATFLEIISL